MTAFAERLRHLATTSFGCPTLAAGAERAAALLDALDAEHVEIDGGMWGRWCVGCEQPWPCGTHEILHQNDEEFPEQTGAQK